MWTYYFGETLKSFCSKSKLLQICFNEIPLHLGFPPGAYRKKQQNERNVVQIIFIKFFLQAWQIITKFIRAAIKLLYQELPEHSIGRL